MSASVTDNSALQRYELPVEGDTAFLTYERPPVARAMRAGRWKR